MKTCFRLTGIGVLTAAALLSQGPDFARVRGEISPMPAGVSSLTVELSGSGPTESARVGPDGTFEFHFSPRGTYELKVLTSDGSVVHQETVVVTGGNQLLSVRVSEPGPGRRTSGGSTVSLRQLSHKVPAPARKAFDKGSQAESKGHYDAAADFFRQAVGIDPEFADAFNELGATQAKQGDFAHAAESFQKAIDAVPDHALALSNLSIVLAKMRRFEEASTVARRALQLMPGSGALRFVLATSLLLSKGDSDEVLDNLERAAGEVPRAHLVAAQLLVRRGKRDEASRHVQDYLRAAPADDREREQAKALLGELRP
jgi:thioredoxin-like negative regulator of GroEL